MDGSVDAAGSRAPEIDELRSLVADLVEEAPQDVDPRANLFEQGLQSIALMRLVGRWRDEGYDVGFGDLADRPTLAEWAEILAGATVSGPAPESDGPALEADGPAPEADAGADPEFALAPLQHAYWIGRDPNQRLGGVAPHLYLEFDGAGVDPVRLEAAFDRLVRRHEMLRMRATDDGRQRISPPAPWRRLRVHDLRDLGGDEVERRLAEVREEMSHELLDIAGGEVFRAALSLLPHGHGAGLGAGLGGRADGPEGDPTRLHLDVDMIAADAVSYRVMLADLARFYDDPDAEPTPPGCSYRDYLAARPGARREARARAEAHWAGRLPELPGAPELPLAADPGDRARAVRLAFFLDRDARAEITSAARRRGITPSVAVATAFAEVIGTWSAQPRFLLNVPLFDRERVHPDIDQVVGDFTGSVMLEIDLREPATFLERARAVQARLHTDATHRDHTGLEVLRDLGRRAGDQVLAPVVFTSGLDLGELFDARARRCFGDPVWILSQGPQVVLDAQTSEIDDGILVNWDVRENEFAPGVPAAMFETFTGLVRGLADDAFWARPVGDLLPAAQREVRDRANATDRRDAPDLLHRRFFARAGGRAELTAIGWAGGSLNHRELAARALRVAGGLHARGVRPGDPVAVTLPRGPEQVVAALGVLAAGAVYVPVGVEQPAARAGRIAAVSGHTVVIAGSGSSGSDAPGRVALTDLLAAEPLHAPVLVDPEQPAYLLFTSGSTGEPKGVEVPHRAAMATIDDLIRRFRLGAQDRTLMVSALDFDLSVFDIFAMLSVGGAVVVLDQELRRDAEHWAALIREHRVSVLNCVPALLDALLRSGAELGDSLRQVILGGDKVGTDLPGRLRERVPGCKFAGLGGTTETAIHSTICVVDQPALDWTCVPYGTPLDNVRLRVADHLGRDVPDWVPGELWIGGAGVAHGYRGDPARTADRFLEIDGFRWYRTGDLARYRPDGAVEFIGRRDNQVKINGYRIELGEVEAAALELPGVDAAVAVVLGGTVLGGAGTVRTLALAVRGGAGPVDPDAVRRELADRLPAHMLPQSVVPVDALPLTANGKIDRPAVTRLVAEAVESIEGSADELTPPRTPLESVVASVWAEVLERDRVGVDQSLFSVGGDSVLATVIVSRLRELLDTHEVSVRMMFGAPTPAGLAAAMLEASTDPDRLTAVAEIVRDVAFMSDDEVERALTDPAGRG